MFAMLASLREFGRRVTGHVYSFVVGVIGGVLGLASAIYAEARPGSASLVPLWVWLPLLAGGFLLAIFRTFHDVRIQRDAAKDEIERRFSAMRYALQRGGIDYHLNLNPDGTWDIEVGLKLANNSAEYLRYEIEDMAVILGSRSVENPQFFNRGVIIPPNGTDVFRYPFVHGVPADWQTGSIKFTVRYGHPSAPLRYRKSQELKLRTSRLLGPPPPHNIEIGADLVSDPDVEDISASLVTFDGGRATQLRDAVRRVEQAK
jgi:hypothetical protein